MNNYTQKDFITLAQTIAAWNNGRKPIVFVKNMKVLDKFPFIFTEIKDKRTENYLGYEIISQENNPEVEDNCLMFVSIMEDGSYGKVLGKLPVNFQISVENYRLLEDK